MIDLHHHDTGSLLDAFGTPEQVVAKIKSLNRKAMAITNHDIVYTLPFYWDLCKKEKIKMIYGVETRTVPNIEEAIANKVRHSNHLTVLAHNVTGYKNLMQIVTKAHTREYMYYLPRIDFRVLNEYKEGLTILSGCPSSYLSELILNDDLTGAVKFAKGMKENLGNNFYLEAQPTDIDLTAKLAPALRAISKKLDIPIVLTNDVHFLEKGQEHLCNILRSIRERTTYKLLNFRYPDSLYCMTDDEVFAQAKKTLGDFYTDTEIYAMITLQETIVSNCEDVDIPITSNIRSGYDSPYAALREKALAGLERHGRKDDPIYLARMEQELDLIDRKGFSDYFHVVSDIVNWAKSQDILVGDSRGSSACSLVCYTVGITNTDPIQYDLVMERFLSEDRVDPPDIDVDFQHSKRDAVIRFVTERFGAANVAHLATFVRFKGKNTLGEIGKVFEIPRDKIEAVQNVLVERGKADARASATIEDTFVDFKVAREIAEAYPDILSAIQFEGQIRHIGIHAAGIVIGNAPLIDSIALIEKADETGERVNVASVDGDSVYLLGFLKMDLLGIKNLTMIKDMMDDVGMQQEQLQFLDLEDKEVLHLFSHDPRGIFQFGATATASVARQLGIDTFDDVIAAIALPRPGPLHTGNTQMFTQHKNAGTRKNWDLDLMNDITKTTYGLIVFQEQVLRVMREVGNMNWQEVAAIRNAMSKSYGDEYFNKYREIFVKGSVAKCGITPEYANELFDYTSTFGSWAFNKAHAVGYSFMSYYTAYFKATYPRVFYKVLCNYSDMEETKTYLREYKERGYGRILPPKINKSKLNWSLEGDDLRAGLLTVLPQTASEHIIELYPIKDVADLEERAMRRKVNVRVLRLIEENKMFDEDDNFDPFGLYAFAERMSYVPGRTHKIGDMGYSFETRKMTIAGVLNDQINVKSITELKQSVKLQDWKQRFDEKWGDAWAILYVADETGAQINVHTKNYLYPKIKDMLWSKKIKEDIIIIDGIVPGNSNYMIAKDVREWNDHKAPLAKCYKCSLINSTFTNDDGDKLSKLMFVAEAPGMVEAQKGVPLVGKAGMKLWEICDEIGLKREQIYLNNTCRCHPTDSNGKNRTPESIEIESCKDRLLAEIKAVPDRIVVALGGTAFHAITGSEEKISAVVGTEIQCEGFICIPCFHPASLLYPGGEKNLVSIKQTLQHVKDIAGIASLASLEMEVSKEGMKETA